MGVETSATDLISAGLGDAGLVEACQEGTHDEDAAPQCGTALHEFLTAQIFHVELVGLELPCVVAQLGDPYAHAAQQVDEVVDIKDVGHVADDDRLGGEQDG